MAMFPNVYVAMVMISTMGIISMSISYCPYALLGQYHEMKEVQTHYCFHPSFCACNTSKWIHKVEAAQRQDLLFLIPPPVHPAQSWELPQRLWHRLCDPLLSSESL